VGSLSSWKNPNDGLRLYTSYYETALIWYRYPVPDDVNLTIQFTHMGGKLEHISGGHPIVVMLSSLGAGGSTDTGYSIELGLDANTHGVLKKIGKVVVDNPYAVLAYGEMLTIRVMKRGGFIRCWLNEHLIFDYLDGEPLTEFQYIGFGLGKHYQSHLTGHSYSEAFVHSVLISEPQR